MNRSLLFLLLKGFEWLLRDGELCIDWFESLPAPLAVLELLSCDCGGKCENNRCCCIFNQLHCTDACGYSKEKCDNSTELEGGSSEDSDYENNNELDDDGSYDKN